MTIKGYTKGYIVQYVVADLDGTVIDTFDDRETAEACAEDGQQIVELDGYGYVAEITDGTERDVFTTDESKDFPEWTTDFAVEDGPAPLTAQGILQAQRNTEVPFGGYSYPICFDVPSLAPRFPWTRG